MFVVCMCVFLCLLHCVCEIKSIIIRISSSYGIDNVLDRGVLYAGDVGGTCGPSHRLF